MGQEELDEILKEIEKITKEAERVRHVFWVALEKLGNPHGLTEANIKKLEGVRDQITQALKPLSDMREQAIDKRIELERIEHEREKRE